MSTFGLKIFSGNSNPALVEQICKTLEIHTGEAIIDKFSDGEIRVEISENVRGADVFVIQSGADPINDNIMELLIMIDALKRASAKRITAVLPYYPYSRQDRKNKPRVPITARLMADLITRAGANRVLTMDLHAGQIQGFFDIPVDNLYGSPILVPAVKELFDKENLVIVSPDAGGVPRARAYAEKLGASLALIDKRRTGVNEAKAMNIIGCVEGKDTLILDDMIDTAGTLVESVSKLNEEGAKSVSACATHAILSGPAIERINSSQLENVIVTDTLPLSSAAEKCTKIQLVSAEKLFAKAIRNIHNEDAMSDLFDVRY
jgi:ribose-phosphate pyrophosphokinase